MNIKTMHPLSSAETSKISTRARIAAGLLAVGLVFFFALPAAAQKTELKVGLVAFLSGPAAGPFGIPFRNGAEMVIGGINSGTLPAPYDTGKGIAGVKIVTIVIDEAGGSTKQVTEFRNLVQRQNVDLVVGYISSGDCLAIAPVADEMKVLTILADCGTPRIFEEASYKYVFRTRPHAAMDNISAARYLLDKVPGLRTYAGINQNYAWGQDSWRDFDAAMQALKPMTEATTEQFPKIFAGQYSSEISALMLSQADAVHSSLWGGDLESFIFQATARGLDKRTQLVLTASEPYMFRLGKRMPDGVIIGARGPYGVFAHDTPLNRWFRKNYVDRYATQPVYASYVVGQAFLALKQAIEAAHAANNGNWPSVDQIISAMEYMEFEAFGSTVSMSLGKGHQAVTEAAVGVFKFDVDANEATIQDIKYYAAECVNPPEGISSVDWINGGMQGAKCN